MIEGLNKHFALQWKALQLAIRTSDLSTKEGHRYKRLFKVWLFREKNGIDEIVVKECGDIG